MTSLAESPIHRYTHDNPPPGVKTRDQMGSGGTVDCDVAIVGSGAGGATAAAELAEAGFDVIVLEEGSYHGTTDFTPRALGMIRKLFRDGGASAALGKPPILYQEGRTVGGSAVAYGAMSWRTPQRILDKWSQELDLPGLSPKAMAPYFDRVERRLHVSYQDPHTIGRDNQILKEGADRLSWPIDRNRRAQLHCAGSNNCAFGCPTGAKQSPLVTYVPRALHFGARIYANVRVDRVSRKGTRATGVEASILDEYGKPKARLTVRSRLVIVSTGSIQTPAILKRSGFRSASGQLGRNLSMHPNLKVIALFEDEVRGWEGVHQAFQVRQFADRGVPVLAAVNVPPSILAMGLHQIGAELGELMKDYRRFVIAGLLCEDTGTGRVRVAPGGLPVPFYALSARDFQNMKEGAAGLCELLFEAGARKILTPFPSFPLLASPDDARKIPTKPIRAADTEVLTVHMMGTARMGKDPRLAVTGDFGLFHGADGLMVSDASLFPTPVGINPCETIQALSTRNAGYIIENRTRLLG